MTPQEVMGMYILALVALDVFVNLAWGTGRAVEEAIT
jgi:hypothetical protein